MYMIHEKKINVGNLKTSLEKYGPYNKQEEIDKKIMLDYINDFDDEEQLNFIY